MIESGEVKSNCDLARKLRLDQSYIARTIRLASLAPDIVEAVLRGDEPSGLSLKSMGTEIPLSWEEQRNMLGMCAAGEPAASHGPRRPDLAAVVSAWPALPEPLKAGITAMVKGAT
jgi:hypothetical protein